MTPEVLYNGPGTAQLCCIGHMTRKVWYMADIEWAVRDPPTQNTPHTH